MYDNRSVSVVMAVYNAETLLGRALDSIRCQTYSDLDIIIIDDGSSDNSLQICREYEAKDSRIRVFTQENQGIAKTMLRATSLAKGMYIVYVDNDDWTDNTFIERLVSVNADGKYDLVMSSFVDSNGRTYQDGLPVGVYTCGEVIENIRQSETRTIADILTYYLSKLFCTEKALKAWQDIDKSLIMYPDCDFGLAYLLNCDFILSTEPCGYHYTIRDNSISHSKKNYLKQLDNLSVLYRSMLKKIQDHPLEQQLGIYIKKRILQHYITTFHQLGFFASTGIYPYGIPFTEEELSGKRIVLYGAGVVGLSYYSDLERYNISPVLWVDINYKNIDNCGHKIFPVESIADEEFDCILVAIGWRVYAEEIRKNLIEIGIPADKILWRKPKGLLL